MASTINASISSSGIVQTADASGVLSLQSNGTTGLSIGSGGKFILPTTSLTTASAGTLEYDGGELYFTPQGTERGLLSSAQYFRLNSNLAGGNVTTVQNTFGVSCTLSSNTIYAFELEYVLNKTAGATSHTISYGFGGTATNNNIFWNMRRIGNTGVTFPWLTVNTVGLVPGTFNSASQQVVTGAIASATYIDLVNIKGTISVSTGGTFIPQYQLSAAPGGAYSTIAGSWISVYPIGASGGNTSVGTWA